ncbi:hypothetical protein H4R18_005532 [Coemansia javaensis]|uniref:Uncharacterized protein n=1 Tax=Coemansia javaensis TaxID=2761396 RepID=A0A9W8H893_9FUNG|nr:hypothetical protein H4R18_005532 [Coemansia javaensis]
MSTEQLHVYRQLLREVRRQCVSAGSRRAWAAQLRSQWRAAPGGLRAAHNALTYLASGRRYRELQAEFSPKMAESDRIERSARRVGLATPKAYNGQTK